MLTTAVRVQLALFLVIAVTGVVYAGGNYAGLDRLFGGTDYLVEVRLADSGGVFENAEVTYRGVPVGRVGELHLTDTGVRVDLHLDSSGPDIPAQTSAIVANRSAIGEQFIDLEPHRKGAPFLEDGSVIGQQRTALPPAPEDVLANLDELVTTVPTDSLRTVLDEGHAAFRGTGPPLQSLLDSANSLTDAAIANAPQTKSLLSHGRTALETQRRDAGRIAEFSAGLDEVSAQLEAADPRLRELIERTPRVARQVDEVLRSAGPQLGVLVANLLTTAQITTDRTDALEQMLVELPVMTAFTPGMSDDRDTGHQAFVFTYGDPLSCTKGYEDTLRRAADATTPVPTNFEAHCAEPPGSPISVRGSQHAPRGDPPEAVPPPPPPELTGLDDAALPGPISLIDPGDNPANLAQLLGLPG